MQMQHGYLFIYLFIFYNRTIFINIINQYRMNEITYCLGHHEYSRQSSLFNALFSTFERKKRDSNYDLLDNTIIHP